MTLKVEDGTGGNALVSHNTFVNYCESHGYVLDGVFDDDQIDQAIMRGSMNISTAWSFQGYKKGARTQVMAFPRTGVIDTEGYSVDGTTIPREVQWATCEASWYELNNPGGLTPTVDLTSRITQETVGPLSVSYAAPDNDADAYRPQLLIIYDLLKPLLILKKRGKYAGRVNRG